MKTRICNFLIQTGSACAHIEIRFMDEVGQLREDVIRDVVLVIEDEVFQELFIHHHGARIFKSVTKQSSLIFVCLFNIKIFYSEIDIHDYLNKGLVKDKIYC